MKMIKTFSREELYEEIWEISAKQVSLKYDLSYSDLLKKCKEFEIPIPKGSYWYRKNTGDADKLENELTVIRRGKKKYFVLTY